MGNDYQSCGNQYSERQHKVTLTKPFYIGKYEVTQMLYKAVMGKKYSNSPDDNPVVGIYPNEINIFLDKLNKLTAGNRPSDYVFDLPTEAQWEYACRAGTNTSLNSGKNITVETGRCTNLDKLAWYEVGQPQWKADYSGELHSVGGKAPNNWGIYDMHGNAAEWCRDYYCEYTYNDAVDPENRTPENKEFPERVVRGGSFKAIPRSCRSASRFSDCETQPRDNYDVGFRIALVPVVVEVH